MADEQQEEWRPIPGHPGYEVSDAGRVRSWRYRWGFCGTPHPLKLKQHRDGYLIFGAWNRSGRRHMLFVHRAALMAFRGLPRAEEDTRHLDGQRTNNRLSNLAWGSPKENSADAAHHGTQVRGEKVGRAKLTAIQVRAIRALRGRESQGVTAGRYGVDRGTISSIQLRRTWAWLI